MIRRAFGIAPVGVVAACVLASGCGNSIYTTSPATSPLPLLDDGQPRSPTPDVSVTSAGFVPQVLHVNAPVTVVFTNSDTVSHTLRNAPQLGWDDCPEMNEPLMLGPGDVGRVAFSEADAVCTYVDAARPDDKAFQGYIAIHRVS
jgi:hypothetical protein